MAAAGRTASGRVARNAAVRTFGEVVAKGASVVFFVVMARKLGERGFGDFMFALSFMTVLLVASGFGTEDLLAREVSRRRDRVHDYLSNVVAVKAVTTVAIFAIAVAIVNIADYSSDVRLTVYLVGAGVALENFGRTWGSVFQAFERQEFISAVLILQRVLTAAVGIAILLSGGGLVAASVVFLAGAFVAFVVGAWALPRFVVRPRIAIDRSRWWPLIKAGFPIGLSALLFSVLIRFDQTLLSFLAEGGNREVGFYAAAFRLIEATLFVSWSFNAAMLPWLSRHKSTTGGEVARGYEFGLKVLTAVLLPVALLFALLAGPLIDLLYGERFADAVPSLQLLGTMTVFFGINQFAGSVLIARDRPGLFSKLLLGITVLNVGLNVALIPTLGATGAATSALVSGAVLAAAGMVVLHRLLGGTNLVRSFASPLVAGGAMAAVIVLSGLPAVPAAVLGSLAYVGVLVSVERLAHPQDLELLTAAVARALDRVPRGEEPDGADASAPAPIESV